MLHYNILHEICSTHVKKNVLLKLLDNKQDIELNKFIQNIVERNGLLVCE